MEKITNTKLRSLKEDGMVGLVFFRANTLSEVIDRLESEVH